MAKIKKIKLGSTTYDLCDADALHTHQVVKQDGITGATVNRFGTCSTGASTAAKTVSITTGTFTLEAGAKVTVKFASKNTANSPTLNVNSTGAKNIFHNGAQIETNTNKGLLAGTVEFVYDGTQWHLIGNYIDTNSAHAINSGTKKDATTEIVGSTSTGTLTMANSGVTQGTYGQTADKAATSGDTFVVPEISVNTKGIVTGAASRTITLPSESSLTIYDKPYTDTDDMVYAVSNLVEGGTRGHSVTATYTGLPTKAYVDKVVSGAVQYLGTVSGLEGLSTTAGKGDFYRVATAFSFGTTSEKAHVGDILIATKDNPSKTTTDWDLIHAEVDSNTWVANTKVAAGYVAAPTASNPNKVWRTDESGNPAWRDPSTPEAFLTWGGKNFSSSYGPIDAAMIPQLGANRLAFFPKDKVVLEYSTNSGSTWTAVTNDTLKAKLFSTAGSYFYIGNSSATGIDKSTYMCRVTLTTSSACYTALNKFAIHVSTEGSTGCYCSIDARTKANQDSNTDTWKNFANKVPISGWSGWNIINTSEITTHGNTSSQYSQLRFTFGVTSHPATSEYKGLYIDRIMGFGGLGWSTPSNMAREGTLYSYDYNQDATFPGNVSVASGKKFVGNLNGNADTATNVAWSGVTSKPSYYDAKAIKAITREDESTTFTYTCMDGTTGTFTQQDKKVATLNDDTINEAYKVLFTKTDSSDHSGDVVYKNANAKIFPSRDGYYDDSDGFWWPGGTKMVLGSDEFKTWDEEYWYDNSYEDENGDWIEDGWWEWEYVDNSDSVTGTGHLEVTGNILVGGGGCYDNSYGVFPAKNYTGSLGSSYRAWESVYAYNIYQNGYRLLTNNLEVDGVRVYAPYTWTTPTIKHYATCSTSASAAAKTASISSSYGSSINLSSGLRVAIKFSSANTASNPTLNLNSKGAKNIYHNGAQITTGENKSLLKGVCEFVYDGTQWHLIGNYINSQYTAYVGAVDTASNAVTTNGNTYLKLYEDSTKKSQFKISGSDGPTVTSDASGNITVGLSDSGVTASSYGPSANATPAHGATFNVPEITVNAKGIVTSAATRTITLPADNNTHNSHAIISGTKADGSTQIKGTASSGDITLGDSGVTANSYGPSANATPAHGATFSVPEIKVNAKGIVTSAATRTITLPADSNTHYVTGLYVGATNTKSNATTSNGNTYIKLYDDSTKRAEFNIKGTGTATVTSDASGNITINASNTNTHYTTSLWAGANNDTKSNAETSNGNTYLKLFDDTTRRSTLNIKGTGATTVTSDANGVITINSTDTNTNTHQSSKNIVGTSASSTANAATTSNGVYLNHLEDNTLTSAHKISGSGAATVTSDASGNITITSTNSTTGLYVGASGAKSNAATSDGGTFLKLYDDSTKRAEFKIAGGGATAVSSDANGNITITSTDNDTKNTTGGDNTSSKIFLVGMTAQTTSNGTSRTYTHDTAYVGTDGCLYSGGTKVLTAHQSVTNSAPTLSWGTTSTIGSIGGTNLTVTMPANPNTNTHYTTKLVATTSSGTAHAATTNGNTYLRLFDDSTARQSIKITGSGATTVTSDASGVITISSTDTNTNTDTKVTQAYSTTSNSYPLLMCATAGVSSTSSRGATTAIVNNQLYANPSTGQLTAKIFSASSDKRLKENIVEYVPEHSILDLPVYKYNFIDDAAKIAHIGCLAQDLQTICPEIVSEGDNGYLSINESKIVYLLLDEVKKLKAEVEELKTKA